VRLELPTAEHESMIDRQSEVAQDQLACIECRGTWTEPSERWRIYLTEDDPREPILYCADCAAYEFGP
jgi:hypothetical protein